MGFSFRNMALTGIYAAHGVAQGLLEARKFEIEEMRRRRMEDMQNKQLAMQRFQAESEAIYQSKSLLSQRERLQVELAQLEDSKRRFREQMRLERDQLKETGRHNLADEAEAKRAHEAQEGLAGRRADIAKLRADTDALRAAQMAEKTYRADIQTIIVEYGRAKREALAKLFASKIKRWQDLDKPGAITAMLQQADMIATEQIKPQVDAYNQLTGSTLQWMTPEIAAVTGERLPRPISMADIQATSDPQQVAEEARSLVGPMLEQALVEMKSNVDFKRLYNMGHLTDWELAVLETAEPALYEKYREREQRRTKSEQEAADNIKAQREKEYEKRLTDERVPSNMRESPSVIPGL